MSGDRAAALQVDPLTATSTQLRAEIARLRLAADRLEAYLVAEFGIADVTAAGATAASVSNVTGHRAGWSVSASTYSTGGCRCDGCSLAMRRAEDEAGLTTRAPAAARKPARNVPPPEHATVHRSAADTWPGRA